MESCYWHCCEKWFCYDESIALWEDPEAECRNQNGWDNMAYWDSIAVIANRSIVTIQPTSENKIIQLPPQLILPNEDITDQLNLQEDLHRRLSEVFQHSSMLKDTPLNNINEADEVDSSTTLQLPPAKVIFTLDDETEKDNEYNTLKESRSHEQLNTIQEVAENTTMDYIKSGSAEDLPTAIVPVAGLFEAKSHERIYPMLSRRPTELRLIKQSSMPNFYVETPDLSGMPPPLSHEKILTSPILPNTPKFKYDLRSIVEIEKNKQADEVSETEQKSKRLIHLRKKIAPLIIKKPSLKNLTLKPNNENHPS